MCCGLKDSDACKGEDCSCEHADVLDFVVLDEEGRKKYPLGWYCPRCKKVNSPYITMCECI